VYIGSDGARHLATCGEGAPIHISSSKIPQPLFAELAKIKVAGQFVQFGGRFVNAQNSVTPRKNYDDKERVSMPRFEFQFTNVRVMD